MRIRYDAQADVLFLILGEGAPADAIEEPGGVIVSYGQDGEPLSVELLNASARGLVPAGDVRVTLETKAGG